MAIINNHIENIAEGRKAKAPYNFVPINNDNEIKKLTLDNRVDYDIYHKDNSTGYIDIEIETKTETLIGKSSESPDFFKAGEQVLMPGSSIRGMIRTLIEIISYGKFGKFEDKRLYFRGIFDQPLKKEYSKYKISTFNYNTKISAYTCEAGLLSYINNKYYITPCGMPTQKSRDSVKTIFNNKGKSYNLFKFEKINNIYYVISGDMNNKRNEWCIDLNNKSAQKFEIPKSDIENYENDENRSEDVINLLELSKTREVPCFYKKINGAVIFGHTVMMRLPYKFKIGDHIPTNHKNDKIYDYAEIMFGCLRDQLENSIAGKIFFEDAKLIEGQKDIYSQKTPKICKPLLEPKPTTFQHYLVQENDVKENLYHYNVIRYPKNNTDSNDLAAIRGNKLYWHRTPDWQKENQELEDKGEYEAQINPIKQGVKFQGKIRFENLSKDELGILLLALDLPLGHAHKIGMGKPYGLGSIRVTPQLFISNRKKRYSDLSFELSNKLKNSDEIEKYKNYAVNTILNSLNQDENHYSFEDFRNLYRMKELYTILDFDTKPKNNLTEYLVLDMENQRNDFSARKVLPLPSKVKKN